MATNFSVEICEISPLTFKIRRPVIRKRIAISHFKTVHLR